MDVSDDDLKLQRLLNPVVRLATHSHEETISSDQAGKCVQTACPGPEEKTANANRQSVTILFLNTCVISLAC